MPGTKLSRKRRLKDDSSSGGNRVAFSSEQQVTASHCPSLLSDATLDAIWKDLEEGIKQIYLKQNLNMSKNRYIELNT